MMAAREKMLVAAGLICVIHSTDAQNCKAVDVYRVGEGVTSNVEKSRWEGECTRKPS